MIITETIGTLVAPIIQRNAPGRPELREVIDAIVDETGIRRKEARGFVMSVRGGIAATLDNGETRWYMSDAWLRRHHDTLEAIAPDGVRSASGDSAHSLLERFVLNPAQGQLGLVHGKHERTWRQDGNLHCTFDICVDLVPSVS